MIFLIKKILLKSILLNLDKKYEKILEIEEMIQFIKKSNKRGIATFSLMNNIGIIAGGGKLPIAIGSNLIKKNFNVFFFVIEEFFNTKNYEDFNVSIINLKSAKEIINSLKSKNIDSIIMAGNIK